MMNRTAYSLDLAEIAHLDLHCLKIVSVLVCRGERVKDNEFCSMRGIFVKMFVISLLKRDLL